jgi:diguanylate cyclase (GGDEF)-like protein
MKSNQQINILVVDDNEFNIDVIVGFLEGYGYVLYKAFNGVEALELVRQHSFDMILLDVNMPEMNGFEVCKILKSNLETKDIPIIFLTALNDRESVAHAFEIGASDYLQKPYCGIELQMRVKTHLRSKFYLEDIKAKQSKLAQIAVTDNLTKLYNSFYFDSRIKTHQQNGDRFSILYIKLRNIKQINRMVGVDSANKIIKHYAKIIKDIVPNNMLLARLYGSSFGILISGYSNEDIQNFSKKLKLELKQIEDINKIIHYSLVLYTNVVPVTIPEIYKKLLIAAESA